MAPVLSKLERYFTSRTRKTKENQQLVDFSSPNIVTGFQTTRTKKFRFRKGSSIDGHPLNISQGPLPESLKLSTFWLGVSAIYLVASFLVSPFSLPLAMILRVPIGLFLLCAIGNPVSIGKRVLFK